MGRSRKNKITEQFFWFGRETLESPAFRQLSANALRAYFRIALELMHHGGNDNGRLPVTFDQFVKYGIRRHAIKPAIRELEALGFIEVTKRGKASAGEHRFPNHFRLTDRPGVDGERNSLAATCDWKRVKSDEEAEKRALEVREPQKIPRQKFISPVPKASLERVSRASLEIPISQCRNRHYSPSVETVTTSISRVHVHQAEEGDAVTQATSYARWLAERNGITLPSSVPAAPVWHDTSNGTTQRRISAVAFGEIRIDIPHWDWTPAKPKSVRPT
jgi:hypothetical protein